MSFIPKPHEIYKHFKGDLYQIVTIADHTETGERLVVYQALYGDFRTYARPLAMFAEKIDRERYPSAVQEYRFELQGPDAGRRREAEEEEKKSAFLTEAEDETAVKRESASEVQETAEEEPALDPMILEFLDSDSYEQRLNILAGLHHRITDEMITTMAIACDVEIEDGDIEERYEALRACLLTLDRYECSRLR